MLRLAVAFVVAFVAAVACAAALPSDTEAKPTNPFLINVFAPGEAVNGYALQRIYQPSGQGDILGVPHKHGTRFSFNGSSHNIYLHPPHTPKTETYLWSLTDNAPYKPVGGFKGFYQVSFSVRFDGQSANPNKFEFVGAHRTLIAAGTPATWAGWALCNVTSLGPFAGTRPGGYLQLLWREKMATTHRNCTNVQLRAA